MKQVLKFMNRSKVVKLWIDKQCGASRPRWVNMW